MEMFEYVAVLTSIVIGLGMAQLLKGAARLVQHPGRDKAYWVHLSWACYMFFMAVFWWWWEFRLGEVEVWTLGLYLFVLMYAFVIYALCALLFPDDLEGYTGYEDYFMSRRVWFFGGLVALHVLDLGDTWLKGPEHFANLGLEYQLAAGVSVALFVPAMVTGNRRLHGGVALVSLAYRVWFALRYFETVL